MKEYKIIKELTARSLETEVNRWIHIYEPLGPPFVHDTWVFQAMTLRKCD
jgi:hypothetical protein